MHHRTFALASLRLAPIQCAAWGHPVTTGHPTIDYFLSCDRMEPDDAAAHYTEALVRLPGIGTSYRPFPFEGAVPRATLGLHEAAHLYFFPHSPFKIHPEADALVAEVLAADPLGELVTFASRNPAIDTDYLERLQRHLARHGVGAERIRRFPPTTRAMYLRIAAACDVMLDSLFWSGGNTTIDALTVGLPVVTLPGRTMRSRQTLGMLLEMGIGELVAADRSDYVRSALRLACDRPWRQSISGRIAASRERIFNDRRPIAALERFLQDVARGDSAARMPTRA